MRLGDVLRLVRSHGLMVRHDGGGELAVTKCVPGAVVPRHLMGELTDHRGTLSRPCAVCRALVAAPCRAGEVCDQRRCPYRDTQGAEP